MNQQIVLCIDKESFQYPAMVGLADESLASQSWLVCVTEAQEARDLINTRRDIGQVWIVSCADMSGINLAAALKHDCPRMPVTLVVGEPNGSLASRAACAHVDALWTKQEFIRAYMTCKNQAVWGVGEPDSVGSTIGASGLYQIGMSMHQSETGGESCVRGGDSRQTPDKQAFVTVPEVAPTAEGIVQHVPAKPSTVVSVVSASGGAGKSTVAASLAMVSQSCGLKTLVIDADLQFGDIHYLLGVENPLRLSEDMTPETLCHAVTASHGVPHILAAPDKVEKSELIAPMMADVIMAARSVFDVVIVNTGSFWGDVQAQLLEVSDRVLFLMDQRPSSVRSCIHALELCSRLGVASQSFCFAINCFVKTGIVTTVDASCALRGAHVSELAFGGHEIDELLGSGYATELLKISNPFMDSIRQETVLLLRDTFGGHVQQLEQKRSWRPFRRVG